MKLNENEYFGPNTEAFPSSRIQETEGRNINFHFVFISICLSNTHLRAGCSHQSYVSAALSPFHIYLFVSCLSRFFLLYTTNLLINRQKYCYNVVFLKNAISPPRCIPLLNMPSWWNSDICSCRVRTQVYTCECSITFCTVDMPQFQLFRQRVQMTIIALADTQVPFKTKCSTNTWFFPYSKQVLTKLYHCKVHFPKIYNRTRDYSGCL